MAKQYGNSKAEDAFAALLERKYGLIEGEHFVREHSFRRKFTDDRGWAYGIRTDFWFPEWRIVVEFKAGPLGRVMKHKEEADRAEAHHKRRGFSIRDILKVSWSNQLAKFQEVARQADDDPETSGILWILVDDAQMRDDKRYRHYQVPQVRKLREHHRGGWGWNPMSRTECGRLLYMFKEVSELTAEKLYGDEFVNGLPMMNQVMLRAQVENTVRRILPELHTLDTREGLRLIVAQREVDAEDGGKEVEYVSVPVILPPQR